MTQEPPRWSGECPLIWNTIKAEGLRADYTIPNDYTIYPSGIITDAKRAQALGWLEISPPSIMRSPSSIEEYESFNLRLTDEGLATAKAELREKSGPKSHDRQITLVDEQGRKVKRDLRNGRTFAIMNADLNCLIDTAHGDLWRLRRTKNGNVRRRLEAELREMLLLRGKEMRSTASDLYGAICLRLWNPLPPDFWTIPREQLPKHVSERAPAPVM